MKPNSTNLSKCHKAPTRLSEGIGDFNDSDKAITVHFICTKCNEACDLWEAKSTLREEIKNILGDAWMAGHDYATQDEGLEALREANQKDRGVITKSELDIQALIQRKQLEAVEMGWCEAVGRLTKFSPEHAEKVFNDQFKDMFTKALKEK